jgi:dihydropyrimidine dehydrogenase (NAD+) subunit PreA
VTQVVKEVAKGPVWAKLTPATSDIVVEAGATFDPDSLEFEIQVEGLVSSGGLGGPAILPLSLAKMSEMTRAYPEKSFSGIGGIADFRQALNFFLLGCGTVQVCTAAMLDHAVGPNVIKALLAGATEFFEKNTPRGYRGFEDIRGLRRDRVVPHSQIKRPDEADYQGGFEAEGYSQPSPESSLPRS